MRASLKTKYTHLGTLDCKGPWEKCFVGCEIDNADALIRSQENRRKKERREDRGTGGKGRKRWRGEEKREESERRGEER